MHSNCGDGEDLRAHWTARRSNQLVLKKINPKNSLEQLKLQLQHFSHVMQRADSLERTLILGKIQGKRRSQQQKIRWLESISNSMDMNLRKLREIWGFPGGSDGKESACNAGDPGLIPGSGRSAGERIGYPLQYCWASLAAHLVKNPPAIQETWVQSLRWEVLLEKEKAIHSSILAWRIPCPWGHKESGTTE